LIIWKWLTFWAILYNRCAVDMMEQRWPNCTYGARNSHD